MEKDVASSDRSSENDLEQIRIRNNLALVQARTGVENEGSANSNIQDSPFAKAAHGF